MTTLRGFLPTVSPRFPLDLQLLPLIEQRAPGLLVSLPEWRHWGGRDRPHLPLFLDSGGYAALHPQACVQAQQGLGQLVLPDGTVLTPQQVHAEQQGHAHTGSTLDFPVPVTCSAEERQQRLDLSLANALWALQQPRTFRLYASVQPGQDLSALLAAHPDGIALGGLAPYSQDRSFLHHEIQRVRDALPPHLPLHVYGLGHPLSVQTAFAAGATSVDSSSSQRTAVAGHAWDGTHWPLPSAAERLSLAQRNLDQLLPPSPARGPNQLLTWPTGTGKTWTALQRARAVLAQGLKVLLLVPTRALASEVAQTWAAALPEACVQAYTRDVAQPAHYRRSDVLILTPERLFLLLGQWGRHHAWMAQVGLLIIDEFHLIADTSRGATLDATLTLWRVLFPTVPLLALTATCGNPDVIARWLAAEHDPGRPRAVPLTWEAVKVSQVAEKRTVLLQLLERTPLPLTLVFVHARRRTRDLAQTLCAEGWAARAHHSGLSAAERAQTEADCRTGQVQVLICTPTLEVGVNLPADRVVLYDLSHINSGPFGPAFVPLSHNAVWQRAGRAGRLPGQAGHVVVLGVHKERAKSYLKPRFEPLRSPLAQEAFHVQVVLTAVESRIASTRPQLARLLSQTLAAVQGRGLAVDENQLAALVTGGALEEEDGQLSVTPLGRVAQRALLLPEDIRAAEDLPEDPTALDVLLVAAGRIVSRPRIDEDAHAVVQAALQVTPSRLLDAEQVFAEGVTTSALVILDACTDGDTAAAEACGLYPADVTRLREELGRLVQAWCAYLPAHQKLGLVRTMLLAGVGLEAATLALLPGIGGVRARQLVAGGFPHLEALAQAQPAELEEAGFGRARAAQLVEQAEALVRTFDVDPTREPPAGPRPSRTTQPALPDPLRLQRARDLQVTPQGDGFTVTGGAALHRVTPALICDCLDFSSRRRCKHVLAVQLFQGDADLTRSLGILELLEAEGT